MKRREFAVVLAELQMHARHMDQLRGLRERFLRVLTGKKGKETRIALPEPYESLIRALVSQVQSLHRALRAP